MSNTASEAQLRKMLETPIARLIPKLAIPTVISMLVTAIYNMADTFFVGQIGQSASGAVGVVFTLMLVIQAIGFTLGQGAGSNIARLLGQKDTKTADEIGSTAFFTSIFMGTVLLLVGLIFLDPLVRLLGATETIAPYARDYARFILIGAPYMTTAFVLNNILRNQGSAVLSMVGISVGGVLNIALDPLLIHVLNLGISGAAIATIISQAISFVILYVLSVRRGSVKLSLRCFRLRALRRIIPIGAPSFYRQGMASVASILLNRYAGAYGDAAVAAMSIVSKITSFSFSALIGYFQGFQPVCGFNYGAKRFDRVRSSILFSAWSATLGMSFFALLMGLFAPQLVNIFRPGDTEVMIIGSRALRLQCLVMPLIPWTVMSNMSHQALGKSAVASLLAITRQGLFFLPSIIIFTALYGLLGVQSAQSCADLLSFAVAMPFMLRLLKTLRQEENALAQSHV